MRERLTSGTSEQPRKRGSRMHPIGSVRTQSHSYSLLRQDHDARQSYGVCMNTLTWWLCAKAHALLPHCEDSRPPTLSLSTSPPSRSTSAVPRHPPPSATATSSGTFSSVNVGALSMRSESSWASDDSSWDKEDFSAEVLAFFVTALTPLLSGASWRGAPTANPSQSYQCDPADVPGESNPIIIAVVCDVVAQAHRLTKDGSLQKLPLPCPIPKFFNLELGDAGVAEGPALHSQPVLNGSRGHIIVGIVTYVRCFQKRWWEPSYICRDLLTRCGGWSSKPSHAHEAIMIPILRPQDPPTKSGSWASSYAFTQMVLACFLANLAEPQRAEMDASSSAGLRKILMWTESLVARGPS